MEEAEREGILKVMNRSSQIIIHVNFSKWKGEQKDDSSEEEECMAAGDTDDRRRKRGRRRGRGSMHAHGRQTTARVPGWKMDEGGRRPTADTSRTMFVQTDADANPPGPPGLVNENESEDIPDNQ